MALLFLVGLLGLPIAEIYLLIQLGHVIGGWATIALIVAEAVLGSWLFKRAGLRAWRSLQGALAAGRVPGKEIADGALVLLGAVLLMVPGLITDAVGLVCVLPFTRPLVRRLLLRRLGRGVVVTGVGALGGFRRVSTFRGSTPPGAPTPPGQRSTGPGVVVEGEVIE